MRIPTQWCASRLRLSRVLLLTGLLSGCTGPTNSDALKKETTFRQDWVFLYYMPYDNDLGGYAEAVMERIQAGTSGGVEAAVMADLPGDGGMTFVTFKDGVGRPYRDPTMEASGNIDSLDRFLSQAATIFEARRYGVVILDHGGRLDRLARDDHPTLQWLSVDAAAESIGRFRREEPGEVELVFLQVCTKAALAPLYAFRDAGRYTMASQLLLGAPNDYYTPALRSIKPDMTGPEVAAAIAEAEGSEMHLSYTCVDNRVLSRLPRVLRDVELTGLTREALAPTLFDYAGDEYADAAAVLAAAGELETRDWLTDTLRCGHHVSSQPAAILRDRSPDPSALSGLSMYIPPAEGPPEAYKDLALYREVDWLSLMSDALEPAEMGAAP